MHKIQSPLDGAQCLGEMLSKEWDQGARGPWANGSI